MSERVRYFDIAKGIAIFCIIAGHMGNGVINNFVFTFHVPIFFLISGYFLKSNTSLQEFTSKKYRQLIHPYIITCACVIVGVTVRNTIQTHSLEYVVEDVKTWFIASLYGSGTIEYTSPFYMRQIGAIWFLLASFTALLIVRYFVDYKHGWLGIVILAYVGYKTGTMVWMPLSIQAGMTAAVFVYLGWAFRKSKLFEQPVSPVLVGISAIIWLFGVLFCGQFYIVRNYFGNGLFDIIVAVCGSYLVILISKGIELKTRRVANVLEFYGQNTLLILCMHEMELTVLSWDWVWKLGEKLNLQSYQITWIILILKILLFTMGVYCIRFFCNRCKVWKTNISKRNKIHEKNRIIISEKSTVNNSRIEYWDIAKGITIILMILGHAPVPDYLRTIIFSFHMPLFIIVNGYFIKNYHIKQTFVRSVKTLLIPYAAVCLVSAVLSVLVTEGDVSAKILFASKIKAMIGGMSKISTRFLSFDSVWVVWFVCCLFLARNIYVILMKLSGKYHFLYPWGILVISYLGYLMGKYYAFMPWSLDVALVSLIFIGVGNWMRKESFLEKSYCYTLIIPAAIWIYFLKMGISIELATRSYPLGVFCIIEAIAGSIMVIAISKILNKSRLLTITLSWCGRHSMMILGIHCLELMYFDWDKWVYSHLPFTMNWFRIFVIKCGTILLVTGLAVIVQYVIFRMIKKIKKV